MDRNAVLTALEAALSDVLERPVSGLTSDVRLFEDMHMDSTTMLEMLMALEESIGLEVDPEDLDVDDFETVDTFLNFALSAARAKEPASS